MVEVAAGSKHVQRSSVLRHNLLHELVRAYNAVLDAFVIDAMKQDQQMNVNIHLNTEILIT